MVGAADVPASRQDPLLEQLASFELRRGICTNGSTGSVLFMNPELITQVGWSAERRTAVECGAAAETCEAFDACTRPILCPGSAATCASSEARLCVPTEGSPDSLACRIIDPKTPVCALGTLTGNPTCAVGASCGERRCEGTVLHYCYDGLPRATDCADHHVPCAVLDGVAGCGDERCTDTGCRGTTIATCGKGDHTQGGLANVSSSELDGPLRVEGLHDCADTDAKLTCLTETTGLTGCWAASPECKSTDVECDGDTLVGCVYGLIRRGRCSDFPGATCVDDATGPACRLSR